MYISKALKSKELAKCAHEVKAFVTVERTSWYTWVSVFIFPSNITPNMSCPGYESYPGVLRTCPSTG